MAVLFNGMTYYKGNLHLHTTLSDGKRTRQEAAALYKEHGYDFVAVTDHWKTGPEETIDGVLLLPGCEYDFGPNVREGIFHIVSLMPVSLPDVHREDTPAGCIEAIHRAGGLAVLAHPAWSMNTLAQIQRAETADFTEIYNSLSGVPYNCRPDSSYLLDALAATGKAFPLLATDDTHFYEQELCRSFVMVATEALTRDGLYAALKQGDFFASQGPMMTTSFDGRTVTVHTDGVAMLIYYTDGVWNPSRTQCGDSLTEGSFTMADRETFVRVEAVDKEGRRAWSRYYFKNR